MDLQKLLLLPGDTQNQVILRAITPSIMPLLQANSGQCVAQSGNRLKGWVHFADKKLLTSSLDVSVNRLISPIIWAGFGILLIPTQLVALDPSRSMYQYNCRTWTRQVGLPVNAVRALTQTTDGYLWLGTQQGLVRFDGIDFTTITLPDNPLFRHGAITSLAPARDGGLWFGIDGGSFALYDDAGFHAMEQLPWFDSQMRVEALQETRRGWLWVGSGGGMGCCLKGTTNGSLFLPQLSGASTIYEDVRGRVWVGTTDQGVFWLENGRLQALPDPTLKGKAVFAIGCDSHGSLWVGTEVGVHCYDTNFVRHDPVPGVDDVKALLVDREGAVWIGTGGHALIRYLGGDYRRFTHANGLADDFITSLLEDREGSLWIGTHEGLSQLSDVKFPIYSAADGMIGGACHGLGASTNGAIWTATSHGLSWFDGRVFSNYSTNAGLSSQWIKRLLEARNGDLYYINACRSVEVMSHGVIVARYANGDWPTALGEDGQGVVVAVAGGLFRASRAQYSPFVYRNGKAPDLYWVRSMCGARDGSLLVASVNGVFRIKDGVFEQWGAADGMTDLDVLCVAEDLKGVIWAGFRTGMARIWGRQVLKITPHDGLPDNTIRAIVPDDDGCLWLFSENGFLRAERAVLNDFADGKSSSVHCDVFNGLESVKSIDTSDVEYDGCKTSDGRIWFPTPLGPLMIDPLHITRNTIPPPVHIDQIRVNGANQIGPTAATAQPGRGEVVIHYTGLSYIAPQRVQFRYRLEGYDSGWVDAGNRRSVVYANLKPGPYTFTVQACNADGVWSQACDRSVISVPAHFYQRAWFRTLAVIAVIAAAGSGFAWRNRLIRERHQNLQRANELLETRIQERTSELAEQRNLLRTLIDHLPDRIFVKDTQSRVLVNNVAHARFLGFADPAAAAGKTDFDCFPRAVAEKFYAVEQQLIATGAEFEGEEQAVDARTGETRWLQTTKVPLRDQQGRILGLAGINHDITDRKKWEAESESLHRRLLEASRQAGMAEVATNVLHNVGNVLNSVNVSTSIISERTRHSRALALDKMAALLREHESDLAGFLAREGKAREIATFIEKLADAVRSERAELLAEMDLLCRNIEHVNQIIAMQQAHAKPAGVSEIVRPADLVEDVLRLLNESYKRHSIRVLREIADAPPITVDRHQVIQILVNLLDNAKFACDQNPPDARRVTVKLCPVGSDRVRFEVADNGIGISVENLTRIFSHGFTTRKNGHGFGLHSGALAATQLGGSLAAFSAGPGQGAIFTLEIPIGKASSHSPNGH